MRDRGDRERGYYQKIQGDMYVIHEVEFFLLMVMALPKVPNLGVGHE